MAGELELMTADAFDAVAQDLTQAEAARALAEQGRVSAETDRVTAEGTRVSAENTRVQNENIRISNDAIRITTVDTVAALRAFSLAGVTTGRQMSTSGYHSRGDGGGNGFLWDASSTSADNGGTVIRPTAVASNQPGRWLALYPNVINVLQFGAYGDNVNDDTAAITSAFTAAGTGPFLIVFPPGRTFLTTTGIDIVYQDSANAQRVIEGRGAIIRLASTARNSNALRIAVTGGTTENTAKQVRGLVINGLGLTGADLTGTLKAPATTFNAGQTITYDITINNVLETDTFTVVYNGIALPTGGNPYPGWTFSAVYLTANTVRLSVTNTGESQTTLPNFSTSNFYIRTTANLNNGLYLDGTFATYSFIYKFTIRDVYVRGFSGDGIRLDGMVFEGSLNNCFVDKGDTVFTGNGIRIIQRENLNPSSLDIIACQTRGGVIGILIDGIGSLSTENYNIFGGTVLYTGLGGLRCVNARGAIIGVHGEYTNNFHTAGTQNLDAAVITVAGSDFTVQNCYVLPTFTRARVSIRAVVGSGNGTLINNAISGVVGSAPRKYFITGVTSNSSGSVTIIGDDPSASIEVADNVRVNYIGKIMQPNTIAVRPYNMTPAASITPDVRNGSFIIVPLINTDMVIENPLNTLGQNGAEISFSLQQDSVGGRNITFGSDFARSSAAIGTTPFAVTNIVFRRSHGKWREISLTRTD